MRTRMRTLIESSKKGRKETPGEGWSSRLPGNSKHLGPPPLMEQRGTALALVMGPELGPKDVDPYPPARSANSNAQS